MLLSRRSRAGWWRSQLGPGLFLLVASFSHHVQAQAPAACSTEAQNATSGDGLVALAKCYDKAGKTASAWSAYKKAVAATLKEGKADAANQARAEVSRLEGALTRVTVIMPPENVALSGVSVVRGDQAVPRGYWGIPVPVDPGDYVVRASAPGHKSVEASVTAGAGAVASVTLPIMEAGEGGAPAVPAAAVAAPVAVAGGAAAAAAATPAAAPPPAAAAPPPAAPPPPAEAPPPAEPAPAAAAEPAPAAEEPAKAPEEAAPAAQAAPADAPPKSGPGAGPWILGGAGLALAGAGTVFAFLGYQENEAAKDVCPDSPPAACSAGEVDEWRGHTNTASTNYLIAYIGWGVGGAAVIGAATWLLVGGGSKQSARAARSSTALDGSKDLRRPALAFVPVVGPNAFGLIASGTFQ